MKFLLINQYAANKGDRAVLYALCIMLRDLFPDCSISVSTSHPELWNGYDYYIKNNIKFIPSAWDYSRTGKKNLYFQLLQKFQPYTFTILRESFLRGMNLGKLLSNPFFYKNLKASDVVISVGGHHFTTLLSRDLVSSINFDATVASNLRQIICFSQSFGPFEFYNERNKILTKNILINSILLPREQKSLREIEKLTERNNNVIPTFESVLSLAKKIPYNPICNRDKKVGISIYCTQGRSPEEKISYQQNIAGFCDYVISKGFSVIFFPMELNGSGPDDRPFIKEIISLSKNPGKICVMDNDMETHEHLLELSKCRIFLGHKTHSTIFSLATGTPLIAIAYHPKTTEFMKQFGLEGYAVEDSELCLKILIDIFDRLDNEVETVSKKEYCKSLEISDNIKNNLKDAIDLVRKNK